MADAVLVYDDDCGFCTWWADFFAPRTDLRVVGFTDLDESLRERLPEDYERCSHVVTDDGVFSCGGSLEEATLHTRFGRHLRPVVEWLRSVGAYRAVREGAYGWVARNRGRLGRVLSKTPPARR